MNKQLFREITHWQSKTFPDANTASKLAHLDDEVTELREAVEKLKLCRDSAEVELQLKDIESKFADCFLLLYGAAAKWGLSMKHIETIIKQKFEVNKNRTWGEPDERGVVNHIKKS